MKLSKLEETIKQNKPDIKQWLPFMIGLYKMVKDSIEHKPTVTGNSVSKITPTIYLFYQSYSLPVTLYGIYKLIN